MDQLKYCIIILFVLKLVYSEDCVLDRKSLNVAWDTKLQEDILKNYHVMTPPNTNCTNKVYTFFMVRLFGFIQNEEILNLYAWVRLVFTDERLKWNPAEYDGLTETRLSSFRIWTPGLKHINTVDRFYVPYFFTPCDVKHDGKVRCIHRVLMGTECNTKLKDWPFDTQKCTLKFGDDFKSSKVVYTFNGTRGLATSTSESGTGWGIIDYEHSEDPNSEEQLSLTFVLERQAAGLAAIIVVPSVIVFHLTITSLLLDVRGYIRLFLACFSLLIHHNLLQEISEVIPKHSADTPSVLLFIRGSLIVTTIVIILTLILSYLCKREVPPSNWITTVNEYVFKSKVNYVIWPRWKVKNDVVNISEDLGGNKAIVEWIDFGNVVNSFCLILFIFVYIILFLVYMPQPPTFITSID